MSKLIYSMLVLVVSGAALAETKPPPDNVHLMATVSGKPAFRSCSWKEGDDVVSRQHTVSMYVTPGTHTFTVTCDGLSAVRTRTFTAGSNSVNTITVAMD